MTRGIRKGEIRSILVICGVGGEKEREARSDLHADRDSFLVLGSVLKLDRLPKRDRKVVIIHPWM